MMTSIAVVLALAWIVFMIWSWLSPAPKLPDDDAERDREIGFMVGAMGGGMEDAVHARYTINRLEETLGRKATLREIAVAVGVATGDEEAAEEAGKERQ